jgi:23S rRNA (guanosine2251-2'-O)-methyltransferase
MAERHARRALVVGVNPVREAIRAGRAVRVLVGPRDDGRLRQVLAEAAANSLPVESVDRAVLDHLGAGALHQGVAAYVREARVWTLEDVVEAASAPPLFAVLDGIEDPHNFGAILRSCDAFGVDGVIRQTRRAAPLGETVARASAGAAAHVRIADVVNIARTIEWFKARGVWTVGLAAEGRATPEDVDLTLPLAVVVGGEGAGLRRLVRESCDWLVRLPMSGHVESLNASVAVGVMLYEVSRQRRTQGVGGTPQNFRAPGGSVVRE